MRAALGWLKERAGDAMKLAARHGHLTYCTNIHPGETWPEVRASLARHLPAVKRAGRARPSRSASGCGSRRARPTALADAGGARGAAGAARRTAAAIVFTINGFPYGPFHGRPVKEQVYQPGLAPRGAAGLQRPAGRPAGARSCRTTGARRAASAPCRAPSSRSRGAGRGRADRRATWSATPRTSSPAASATGRTHRAGARARALLLPRDDRRDRATSSSSTCSAPPRCGSSASSPGLARGDAETALRRHLGVCYDVCHAAVEFEDPAGSLARAARGRHRACRSCSSARRCAIAAVGPATAGQLAPVRRAGLPAPGGRAHGDGRDPPPRSAGGARGARAQAEAREWRVHFHVPIFLAELQRLLDHPGVPAPRSWRCIASSRSRRTSRSRPTPGTCCRRTTARSTSRARSRASSAGCSSSSAA